MISETKTSLPEPNCPFDSSDPAQLAQLINEQNCLLKDLESVYLRLSRARDRIAGADEEQGKEALGESPSPGVGNGHIASLKKHTGKLETLIGRINEVASHLDELV